MAPSPPAPDRSTTEHRDVLLATLAIWLVAIVLWAAPDLASGPLPGYYPVLLSVTFVLGVALTALLVPVLHWTARMPLGGRLALIGLACLLLAFAHAAADAALVTALKHGAGQPVAPFFQQWTFALLPFVLLYGLAAVAIGLLGANRALRRREQEIAEARHAAYAAEVAALRFQLNPHFLFNTLNAVSALIVSGRAEEADQMTIRLSSFLRRSLEADPTAEVTLDEELATIQSYLEIESVRFGDRLTFEFHCPARLLDAMLPSFLLQPPIENALKYAVAPSRGAVLVSVRAVETATGLRLTVEDDGGKAFGAAPAGGTGVGLANVRRRLAVFYGEAAALEAVATARGFAVTIDLPLRREAGPTTRARHAEPERAAA